MVALPRRTQILEALRANLEAISPHANAKFHHTMQAVFIWQADQLLATGTHASPLAVIVLDGHDRSEELWSCGRVQHTLPLSIYSAIRPDPGDPEGSIREIQYLASDIQAAIEDDLQLGGLAISVDVVGDQFEDSPAEDVYWVETKVSISYRTKIGDPTAA